MTKIPFTKMDGLGNDFVIIDNRSGNIGLTPDQIVAIGNRKTGVGFDQLILLEKSDKAAVKILFFNAKRCVAKPDMPEKKLERWQRISEEAAKQSGRGIIPHVGWAGEYADALNVAVHTDLALFMYETGEREKLDEVLNAHKDIQTAAIVTGPEGGFAEFEADLARMVGLHVCSMGERILRCETAPVVALTATMYATGNLS